MYLVIDTRKQDGTILGHVYGTAKTLAKAIDMRTELAEASDSAHGVPTIWSTTGAWKTDAQVMFCDPRISVLKSAELKQMGDA